MPKSDTWLGTGLERMNGMDSAGSCDSVVSANSGFSDDSLEHLSAEEKACIMFLEETIESLDTDEDSELSSDESDQLATYDSLSSKLADLSATISKSKQNTSQKRSFKEPIKENVGAKLTQSYPIPTPLVVDNNNKPGNKHNQKPAPPPIPIEVNVVVPPSTKPRDNSVEGPLPRGPLSYEALVHLRKNASAKKTPLCPTIDHTIDLDKRLPKEDPNFGNLPKSDSSHSSFKSKTGPPVMGPKPKMYPPNISVKTQKESPIISDSSCSVKHANDSKVVRLEALHKLGLLNDEESENEEEAELSHPKSHSSLDPTADMFTRGPPHSNASRSPSFCFSEVSAEPKNRALQSSASFHHYARRDQQPVSASHPAQSSGLMTEGLECPAALDNHRSSGNYPQPQPVRSAKPRKTTATAQPVSHKPSSSVGYTAMVVPGMGADRKAALRKLGLLKD